jgi:hypothetical protein
VALRAAAHAPLCAADGKPLIYLSFIVRVLLRGLANLREIGVGGIIAYTIQGDRPGPALRARGQTRAACRNGSKKR